MLQDIDTGFIIPNPGKNVKLITNPIYHHNEVFRARVNSNNSVSIAINTPFRLYKNKIHDIDYHCYDSLKLRFVFDISSGEFFACTRFKEIQGYINEDFSEVIFKNTDTKDVLFVYWLLKEMNFLPKSNEIFINDLLFPEFEPDIMCNGIPKIFVATVMIASLLIAQPFYTTSFFIKGFSTTSRWNQFLAKNNAMVVNDLKRSDELSNYISNSATEAMRMFPIWVPTEITSWVEISDVIGNENFSNIDWKPSD